MVDSSAYQTMMPSLIWDGCYDDSWKGIITPESFSHPAKFARGLVERILNYMLAQGWLNRGDVCLDPFGGVGLGGICCASRGVAWVGCELEPRFHQMALANFAMHENKWRQFGDPLPRMVCGDSRRLGEVLREAEAVESLVSSPPFMGQNAVKSNMFDKRPDGSNFGAGQAMQHDYDAKIDYQKRGFLMGKEEYQRWSQTCNLGSITTAADTFWTAARLILLQCHAVLRPDAMTCWVTKDFVRNGRRVPFSADWLRLLQSCGFEPVLWVKASLVKEAREATLFGGHAVRKKERKSFFRRLHESKMSEDDPRRIDHEDVLFARRLPPPHLLLPLVAGAGAGTEEG